MDTHVHCDNCGHMIDVHLPEDFAYSEEYLRWSEVRGQALGGFIIVPRHLCDPCAKLMADAWKGRI